MIKILQSISTGKSLLRTLLYQELKNWQIAGNVLDVGGGRNQDYLKLFRQDNSIKLVTVDLLPAGQETTQLDLEKDPLPNIDSSIDTVILLNVLEHIYNHRFLLAEINRVLVSGGKLIGFVPFLINYHPDPHDYFRYTEEALKKLLTETHFKNIEIKKIGGGPFLVNYNMIMLSVPKIIRLLLYPIYAVLDSLFLKMRPKARSRYPLGYLFIAAK